MLTSMLLPEKPGEKLSSADVAFEEEVGASNHIESSVILWKAIKFTAGFVGFLYR